MIEHHWTATNTTYTVHTTHHVQGLAHLSPGNHPASPAWGNRAIKAWNWTLTTSFA